MNDNNITRIEAGVFRKIFEEMGVWSSFTNITNYISFLDS